jgi:glycerol-3-phosphate cytidylyltransferase
MKVGFTCGSFDLLHAGHIMMLAEAKSYCDYLIVAIQSDPTLDRGSKNKPVQSYEERIIMLKAIRYVDEITYYDTENDLYELLKRIKPDVRIIGSDWQGKQYTGYDLDIPVIFNSRNHGYSSSELRRRVYEAELKKITKY